MPGARGCKSIAVEEEPDWRQALGGVNGLHDATVKEVAFITGTSVGPDGAMRFESASRLRVLVQTQNRDEPAAELLFQGVLSFTYDERLDAEAGSATRGVGPVDKDLPLWTFTFLGMTVRARSCLITPLGPDKLGDGSTLRPQHVDEDGQPLLP
jgi:hypothetical protein